MGIITQAPMLSVIIPAYNEADRIELTIERVLEYLQQCDFSWEVLVVNDGSEDETASMVERYAPFVRHIPLLTNMGKGAAVRVGMLLAQGSYRVFTDADLSTPIEELEKMLVAFSGGADIVIGSRRLDRSLITRPQPWYREVIGVMGNKLVQFLLFKGIEDTQCGFKGCTAHAATVIFSRARIDGFGFDIEMLYLAQRLRLNVVQVPVRWKNDPRSKVRTFRDAIRTMFEVFLIRHYHRSVIIPP